VIRMNKLGIPEATLREPERIRSLKVFSMCVGGCSVLSAFIFFVKWGLDGFASTDGMMLFFVFFLILGVALICLGWVKALQEMQLYEALSRETKATII